MARKAKESNLLDREEIKREKIYSKKSERRVDVPKNDTQIIYKAEDSKKKSKVSKNTAEKKPREQIKKAKEQVKAQNKLKQQEIKQEQKKVKTQRKKRSSKKAEPRGKTKEVKKDVELKKTDKPGKIKQPKKAGKSKVSIQIKDSYIGVLKKISAFIYLAATLVIGIPICIVLYRELPIDSEIGNRLINIGFILIILAKFIVVIRKLLEKKTVYLDVGALIGIIMSFILYRIS